MPKYFLGHDKYMNCPCGALPSPWGPKAPGRCREQGTKGPQEQGKRNQETRDQGTLQFVDTYSENLQDLGEKIAKIRGHISNVLAVLAMSAGSRRKGPSPGKGGTSKLHSPVLGSPCAIVKSWIPLPAFSTERRKNKDTCHLEGHFAKIQVGFLLAKKLCNLHHALFSSC